MEVELGHEKSPINEVRKRTKQFQRSTHCHPPVLGPRYGTRGTPMGIIRVTCLFGPLLTLKEWPSSFEMETMGCAGWTHRQCTAVQLYV